MKIKCSYSIIPLYAKQCQIRSILYFLSSLRLRTKSVLIQQVVLSYFSLPGLAIESRLHTAKLKQYKLFLSIKNT